MKLEKWRKDKQLTYRSLALQLDVSENKAYRLCKDPGIKVYLIDALRIASVTEEEVTFKDLAEVDA